MEPFLSELKSIFAGDSRFNLAFHPVGRWGGPNDSELDVCDADSRVTIKTMLVKRSLQLGFSDVFAREKLRSHGNVCYAGKETSIVVGSDGKIYKCTVAFEDPRNHVGTITEDGQLIIDQALSFNRRLEAAHADYCEKWEQGMDERLGNPQGNRGSDILYMFKMKAEMPEKYREDVKVQGLEPLTALLEQATQLAARDIQRRKELEAGATEGDFREVEERSDGPDGPGLQKETDQK